MKVGFEIHSPAGHQSLSFELPTTVTVGRGNESSVQLADPHLSRRHFLLEVAPPECQVIDLHSRNGTLVNGQTISSSALADGDVISAGETTLTVHVEVPSAQEAETLDLPPAELPAFVSTVVPTPDTIKDNDDSHETFVKHIGDYQILNKIGEGAMGTLYLAEHPNFAEQVAVKLIIPKHQIDKKHQQLFLREAELLSQLRHPRLVRFVDAGTYSTMPFIVMEYVDHVPFDELCANESQAKRIRMACGIISQTLDVLEYIHSQGVVHRDIKPANILLTNQSGKLGIKVSDFGLAKSFQDAGMSGITSEGEARGTLAYMAPEQFLQSRDVGPAADLFSVGVTLYWYLSGSIPYEFKTRQHPAAVILSEPRIPIANRVEGLPKGLPELVQRAMATDPLERYPSATVMRNELRPFLRKST